MDTELVVYVIGLVLCAILLVVAFFLLKATTPKNAGNIQIFEDEEGQEHFNINFTLELEEIEELQSIILDIIKTQNSQALK